MEEESSDAWQGRGDKCVSSTSGIPERRGGRQRYFILGWGGRNYRVSLFHSRGSGWGIVELEHSNNSRIGRRKRSKKKKAEEGGGRRVLSCANEGGKPRNQAFFQHAWEIGCIAVNRGPVKTWASDGGLKKREEGNIFPISLNIWDISDEISVNKRPKKSKAKTGLYKDWNTSLLM